MKVGKYNDVMYQHRLGKLYLSQEINLIFVSIVLPLLALQLSRDG